MFPILHHGAVPLPAAHLLAPNVSTQINVTKYWFTLTGNHSIQRVYFFKLTGLNHSSFLRHAVNVNSMSDVSS